MKKNLWLVLTILSFVVLLISIALSIRTGRTEYPWIVGSMLVGIGCGNQYHQAKKK